MSRPVQTDAITLGANGVLLQLTTNNLTAMSNNYTRVSLAEVAPVLGTRNITLVGTGVINNIANGVTVTAYLNAGIGTAAITWTYSTGLSLINNSGASRNANYFVKLTAAQIVAAIPTAFDAGVYIWLTSSLQKDGGGNLNTFGHRTYACASELAAAPESIVMSAI